MTDFDYARAWKEVSVPAYRLLPPAVHALYAQTTADAADLHQLPDLSMPWPVRRVISDEDAANARPGSDISLRAAFEAIPSDVLALAAHTIHSLGHWWPGLPACADPACGHSAHDHRSKHAQPAREGGTGARCSVWFCECNAYVRPSDWPTDPGRGTGAYWKFSHYADQILRGRLGLPESGDRNFGARGWHMAVHEGIVRYCYSSPSMWTWVEVCPATEFSVASAEPAFRALRNAGNRVTDKRRTRAIDSAIYTAVETFRKSHSGAWPLTSIETVPGARPLWQQFASIVDTYQKEGK